MKQLKITLLFLLGSFLSLSAIVPVDYYSTADSTQDDLLKTKLHLIIKVGTRLGYGSGCSSTWGGFASSDVTADGKVWDMYSNNRPNFSSSCSAASGMNIEHSFAKSWWGGTNNNAYKDLYHLNPSLTAANSARSSYPPGEITVADAKYNNGSFMVGKNITNTAYTDYCFEPDDEYKGDFARAYFYMVTCYQDFTWATSHVYAQYVLENNNYKVFKPWMIDLLLKWHRQDPVSQKEIDRLDAIYAIQNNRNPFIDYPCLVEYIWGNHQQEVVDFSRLMSSSDPGFLSNLDKSGCDCTITDPTITSPKRNTTVSVGSASLNETVSTTIHLSGVLLTQNLSLSLAGSNASYFSLSANVVSSTLAMSGTDITISYCPTVLGTHQAVLTITSSELLAPTTVTLTGNCLAALTSPTNSGLSFISTDATEIQTQQILVKGTNLANPVSLALSGTDVAKFKLSKASFSAAEINAGQMVTLSYTPGAIGTHVATLLISGSDFSSVAVPINAQCAFLALDASEITLSGFNANWTNAGVSSYSLNVYTKNVVGIQPDTVLDERALSNTSIEANTHLTSGGKTYEENGSFRLGTGSGEGTLKISGFDLSAGGTLVINAKYFGSDNSTLLVSVGSALVSTITLTGAFANYQVSIAPTTEQEITLSQGISGKRLNIANLMLIVGGELITNVSVTGYPLTIGSETTHKVAVSMSDVVNYYYTVTPLNYSLSNEIEVIYQLSSEVGNVFDVLQVSGVIKDNVLYLYNLPQSGSLRLIDMVGRTLIQRVVTSSQEIVQLPTSGAYLVQFLDKGQIYNLKIVSF